MKKQYYQPTFQVEQVSGLATMSSASPEKEMQGNPAPQTGDFKVV